MTLTELKAQLDMFDGFNGAIIQSITFQIGTNKVDRQISFDIMAFSTAEGSSGGWKLVTICGSDNIFFGWIETSKNCNLVLNYPVEVVEFAGRLIIDLDPLHQVDSPLGIKLSSYFIGASKLTISVDPRYLGRDDLAPLL